MTKQYSSYVENGIKSALFSLDALIDSEHIEDQAILTEAYRELHGL
jgi:hypothetical protein